MKIIKIFKSSIKEQKLIFYLIASIKSTYVGVGQVSVAVNMLKWDDSQIIYLSVSWIAFTPLVVHLPEEY